MTKPPSTSDKEVHGKQYIRIIAEAYQRASTLASMNDKTFCCNSVLISFGTVADTSIECLHSTTYTWQMESLLPPAPPQSSFDSVPHAFPSLLLSEFSIIGSSKNVPAQ